MGDPFRRLLLDTVQVAVQKEPNRESLHELLRAATPDLKEEDVRDSQKREKAFKALKLRIHPDKHGGDGEERATKLYQDVQPFYTKCVSNLHKPAPPAPPSTRRTASASTMAANGTAPPTHRRATSAPIPQPKKQSEPVFDVRKKWPYLTFDQPGFPAKGCSSDGLSSLVAFQCINARGAIAHGKKIERYFSLDQVLKKPASVYDKFALRGGAKTLKGAVAVKKELMHRGPVVSTSFFLTEAFARMSEHSGAFLLSEMGRTHPILIIGWKFSAAGEMWLTQPLKRSKAENVVVPISFGQFKIDECCLAPESSFEDVPWQNGPYFDYDTSAAPKWRTFSSLRLHLSSADLEKLGECFGEGGIIAAYEKKSSFVVRDQKKLAHSRRCRLLEVKWEKKLGKWLVSCAFAE